MLQGPVTDLADPILLHRELEITELLLAQ